MANKKKIATTAVALTTAAALLLGGTFAWQSISQRALNEASDIVNPGGRLHNDMWYETAETTNSNVYVENFAEDEIFARVRLSEYMEIVMNYGSAAEKVENVAGSKTPLDGSSRTADDATAQNEYDYEYDIHYFGEDNATDEYWTWTTGSEDSETVYYMPTFNVNKDSLAPDLNGLYADRVGGISNREMGQYVDANGDPLENYEGYSDGEPLTGFEIYDGDTNSSDEIGTDPLVLADIIANGTDSTAVVLTDTPVEHTAQPVGATKGLISLTDWLAMVDDAGGVYDEAVHGSYWVYDDSADGDGWVYWSSPIAGKDNAEGKSNTTGLLLDSFTLNEVMDDTWYYAIEVTGQFITADDLGDKPDAASFGLRSTEIGGTGFYRDGETVSDNALEMLRLIGVDTTEDDENSGEPEPEAPKTVDITTATEDYPEIHVNVYDTLKLNDQLMALEYEVDGEKITLVQDQQFIWSNSDPTCIATVVLTDETLVGEKITVVAKDVIGSEYRYAYLIVDGVAVKDGDEVEADYEVTLKNSDSDEMPTITVYSGESVKLNIVDENGEELTDYVFGLTDGEDHEQSDYYTYTHDEENNIIVINNVTEENVTVYANAVVLGETEEDNTYYIAEIIVLPETGGEEEPKGAMYSDGEKCEATRTMYKAANYFGSDGLGIDFVVTDLETLGIITENVTFSLSGDDVSGEYVDGWFKIKSTTPTANLTGNDSFTFTVTMTWGEETYSCDVTVYIVEQNLTMNYSGSPYASGSGITTTVSSDRVDSSGQPMYFDLVGSAIKVNGTEYEPSSRVYAVSNYTDVEWSHDNGIYAMRQNGVTVMELNETTGYLCVNPCYNSYSVDLAVRSNIDLDGDGTEETVESIITLKVNLV